MTRRLRVAFMGTPDFAVPSLTALIDAGHDVVAVYCQPPKPSGRGHHIQKTPIHLIAEKFGLKVRTPTSLRLPDEQQSFVALNLDVAVVAAYGLILPSAILSAPKLGCINIHGSLLPRWRGAAPIHRAILAGDSETGITVMQMDKGLDTGPMLMAEVCPITPSTTTPALHDEMAALGAKLIVLTLDGLAAGTLNATPQPTDGITYAAKVSREDGKIDWTHSAQSIDRQVRALNPWPGCYFTGAGETLKLVRSTIMRGAHGAPGTLLDSQFTVACGQDALRLETVQRAGKAASEGASVLRGMRLSVGALL